MRWCSLLTKFITILVAQQLISTWFLFDFFVTRDSLTASNIWRRKTVDENGTSYNSRTLSFAKEVDRKRCPQWNLSNPGAATFDKLIFIVIDAFGASFIPIIDGHKLNDNQTDDTDPSMDTMPFVISSLRQQAAMGFVARAATPTVTMPRVKALLSGTIPSFVDIIYNLANDVAKFDDDNIIRVAKDQNKTLVFYGDDTWLSLFRKNIFARAKETHSLFANDYTTVDTNVTEKALLEVTTDIIDWDFLLLHYLGLDHIGHVFGTNQNPLIRKKLGEMDTVIKQFHDHMAGKKQHKTLVVICGDHGMSKEGNHGGGSDLEANTAIVLLPIGKNLKLMGDARLTHPHVKQVDLAATLSLVLGMKIPTMSKGVAIEPFLESLWSGDAEGESRIACARLSNLIQIASLLEDNKFETLAQEEKLDRHLNNHLLSESDLMTIAKNYHNVSRRVQESLLQTIASRGYPYVLTCLLIVVAMLSVFSIRKTSLRLLLPTISRIEQILYLAVALIPIIMLGSTDFIEFEHRFWPPFSLISFAILCSTQKDLAKSIPKIDPIRGVLFVATCLVTTLRMFTPDFEQQNSSNGSYSLAVLSVLMLCNFLRQNSDIKKYRGPLVLIIGSVIMFTKHVEESRANSDQLSDVAYCALVQGLATTVVFIFSAIEIMATRNSLGSRESDGIGPVALVIRKIASGWICVVFPLARRRDFVFLIANLMMETSLNSICKTIKLPLVARSIIYYNFAQAAYFNQGNTNSFSSIDVMPAFFAQTTYNIYLAVPLVAIATFSTQIYWLMKLFQRIQDDKTTSIMAAHDRQTHKQTLHAIAQNITTQNTAETSVKLIRELIVMRNFLAQCYYMFVCMWLRNHLFIWSVLSPKLVYQFVTNGTILTIVLVISSLSDLHRLFGQDGDRKSSHMRSSAGFLSGGDV